MTAPPVPEEFVFGGRVETLRMPAPLTRVIAEVVGDADVVLVSEHNQYQSASSVSDVTRWAIEVA